MQLLSSLDIQHGKQKRTIQLVFGELTLDDAVDVLVVSNIPRNLDRPSVGMLLDMRDESASWLSQELPGLPYRHLLVIEPTSDYTPAEITDHLFRAFAPLFVSMFPNGSLAVAAPFQNQPVGPMLSAILKSSIAWIHRGLALRTMKIVVSTRKQAQEAERTFNEIKAGLTLKAVPPLMPSTLRINRNAPPQILPELRNIVESPAPNYEIFISYSHQDAEAADRVVSLIQATAPDVTIFHDAKTLTTGSSWLMKIADSLDSARKVVAIYTPEYWASPYCKDEFGAAWIRHNDTGADILFPIYYRTAKIPYLFQNAQYSDCREGDPAHLSNACTTLCASL